eukprot:1150220-Pelagomonas_calceolata.AAC.5
MPLVFCAHPPTGGGLAGVFGATSPYGAAFTSASQDVEEQPDMALAAAMPVGVEVPRYRPSWVSMRPRPERIARQSIDKF